jgi:hypothetical protein
MLGDCSLFHYDNVYSFYFSTISHFFLNDLKLVKYMNGFGRDVPHILIANVSCLRIL